MAANSVPHRSASVRTSVTFPRDIYEAIERLAEKNKVSVAWMVREAVEQYINNQWPLLDKSNTQI